MLRCCVRSVIRAAVARNRQGSISVQRPSWRNSSEQALLGRRVAASAGPETKHALIQGSSRGLGLEIVTQLLKRPDHNVRAINNSKYPISSGISLQALKAQHGDRLIIEQMDITKPEEVAACAAAVGKQVPYLSLLFNVSGLLHIPGEMGPETALSRITPQAIHACFATNAIGPVLVCQAFEKLLIASVDHGATEESPAIIANVSARVGSIGDNQLGGWYSYRASKTALNQLTKTMSLEFKRRRRRVACVLLHPGTCETDLSAPFQKNVPEGKLFSRERGARQLIQVAESVTMVNTGAYLAWDGTSIPW